MPAPWPSLDRRWPEARMQPDSERDISIEAEEAYVETWERLYALEMGEDELGAPAPRDVPSRPGRSRRGGRTGGP